MYSRRYRGKDLHFEASGGLVNSALVMRDKETDSYWSLMKGRATGGALEGQKLEKLPGAQKVRFAEWVEQYPNTRVLSVDGQEHASDPYTRYWRDDAGFRGQQARDRRLPTKEPIFAFERGAAPFAISHRRVEGGRVVNGPGEAVYFFHRSENASIFESTDAFVSKHGFVRSEGGWKEAKTGAVFDAKQASFHRGDVERVRGLDTFWYTWSLEHPTTKLLN